MHSDDLRTILISIVDDLEKVAISLNVLESGAKGDKFLTVRELVTHKYSQHFASLRASIAALSNTP